LYDDDERRRVPPLLSRSMECLVSTAPPARKPRPQTPILAVNNVEVIYDHVILVL
jgi:hypothetical protein